MQSISAGLIGVLITIAALLYTAGEYKPQTFGAPVDTYQKNLIPLTDSTYELGTTTKAWLNVFTDQLCLAGDCKTSWPTGGGGSGGGTWSTTTSSVAGTLINYPNNTSDVVAIGSNASSTAEFWFDPNTLRSYLSNASTTAFTATTGYFTNLFLNGDTFTEATQDAVGAGFLDGVLVYSDAGNSFTVANNTTEQKVRAYEEGVLVGSRRSINFLDGTGATLTVADDSGNDRTNVTVAATLGTTVSPTELAVTDFGDFSCNGTICLLDTNVVALATQTTGNYVATLADNGGGTLSISGSGAENAAVTAGINLGNSNAWTALQTFAAATSTNFGISHALSFAGTTGTAWSDFCTAITGGAGLCDGTDNTGGGNGLATSTAVVDNYVAVGTSADDVGFYSTFTFNDATSLLTFPNASSTLLTVGNILYTEWITDHSGNGVYIATNDDTSYVQVTTGSVQITNGTTDLIVDQDGSSINGTLDISGATVKQTVYSSFSYSTSTAWTATTTIPLGPAYTAEYWSGVKCFTDAGTLNVSFSDGTNRMNLFNASTTVGTVTLGTNNTFTAGEKRYVDIGTPATSPTKISCSVSRIVNN